MDKFYFIFQTILLVIFSLLGCIALIGALFFSAYHQFFIAGICGFMLCLSLTDKEYRKFLKRDGDGNKNEHDRI